MYDFIAIDFETATSDLASACSLGIVYVSNFEIVDKKYFLIQPPENKYDKYNTEIHGLSFCDTEHSPTFGELWSEISSLFSDCIVVAHNARFDMSVLRKCLDFYHLECNDFQYIDSIAVSNRAIKDNGFSKSLVDRAEYFNIPITNHHNALDDAETCARIVIASVKTTNRRSLKTYCSSFRRRTTHLFSELKPMDKMPDLSYRRRSVKIADYAPSQDACNLSHPFNGKNIVLTGDLSSMTRSCAMQKIADVGGVLKSGVSSKTDYLIIGTQDPSVVGSDGLSTKERKAKELIEKGVNIITLHEKEFIEML